MRFRQSYDAVCLLPGDAQDEQVGQNQARSSDSRDWPRAQENMRTCIHSEALTSVTRAWRLSLPRAR